jgi:hypothetical protein
MTNPIALRRCTAANPQAALMKPRWRVREPVSDFDDQRNFQLFSPYQHNHDNMDSISTVLIYVVAAELLRRCCLILLTAFTGPLSKIPGPTLSMLTSWPWVIQCIRGNQMNVGPALFKKYGDIVRVGE